MKPECLGVIGLGAIGGSVALRAAHAGTPRIQGYARDTRDAVAAAKAGAITEIAHTAEQAVRGADLVVLAAPPVANVAVLERLAPILADSQAWCTDVSSVKSAIMARAASLGLNGRFAGSHPLAGTHASGFSAASDDLFVGAVVYVTVLPGAEQAEAEIADFWERVMGAVPVRIDADEHDRVLAWTSHLPQAVASALAVAFGEAGPRGVSYGPGAISTTRLAASSAEMWTDILIQNRVAVLDALEAFDKTGRRLAVALERNDPAAVRAWLERGAAWRNGVDS